MNSEPGSPSRINDVLARTVLVFLMTLAACFGGLMTGVTGLGWLVHWLGTPKLEPSWDKIAFFGPAVIVAAAHLVYQVVLPHETLR
jgi:cytochrome b subunit of formate dehydrogenase